jgi:hypothetical protein
MEERVKKLQELHARVIEGSKRHPLDHQLQKLVADIKKAELETVMR